MTGASGQEHEPGMRQVRHIHFVGVGGAGMSGIAEVLVNLGYEVSGSDLHDSAVMQGLAQIGVKTYCGHARSQLGNCDVVVYSSAVPNDNPELAEAVQRRIPLVRRAEMLSELMRFNQGIAVAGTHGKTTTTSLIAGILAKAGLDPTYVVGGLLNSISSHARLGKGKFFVAEADESDASFLHLTPVLTVITNIDADHLENYQGDYQCLCAQFVEFIQRLPFYGLAVVCTDDAGVRTILARIDRPTVSYGLDSDADYVGEVLEQRGACSRFRVSRRDEPHWLEAQLHLPGRHNILNALAAIAVADRLGVEAAHIVSGLREFSGISRRSEIKGELSINGKSCLLIDDYAHHPTEITEMVNAVRVAWPNRRLLVVYQPHRYSRLRDLFEDFCVALSVVDVLFLLEVYAAGERAIAGADSRTLCHAIRLRGNTPIFVDERAQLFGLLDRLVLDDDVLLVLGAGDISTLPGHLQQRYGSCAA